MRIALCAAIIGLLSTSAQAQTLGYVGGSNTMRTIQGLDLIGSSQPHWPSLAYGGGTITRWATTNDYWPLFDQAQSEQPADIIWIQVMVQRNPESDDEVADAVAVIEMVRARAPDAEIVVTGMNHWDPLDLCWQFEPPFAQGRPAETALIAAEAAAQTGVTFVDWTFGPLTADLVTTDGCHPNIGGKELLAVQLEEMLGAPEPEPQMITHQQFRDAVREVLGAVADPFSATMLDQILADIKARLVP